MEAHLQQAYILHYRKYRETSLLLECLTQFSGRISLIARGVRRQKSSLKGILQPFMPLEIDWKGKGELPILVMAECCREPLRLSGQSLVCGLYLNELLMRVLHRFDPHENIFNQYDEILHELSVSEDYEIHLRKFEKQLLNEIGYGLPLGRDANSGLNLDPSKHYFYDLNDGFTEITGLINPQQQRFVFPGSSLHAIASDDYANITVLKDAKRLMRLAFLPLLGDKPLRSRELIL